MKNVTASNLHTNIDTYANNIQSGSAPFVSIYSVTLCFCAAICALNTHWNSYYQHLKIAQNMNGWQWIARAWKSFSKNVSWEAFSQVLERIRANSVHDTFLLKLFHTRVRVRLLNTLTHRMAWMRATHRSAIVLLMPYRFERVNCSSVHCLTFKQWINWLIPMSFYISCNSHLFLWNTMKLCDLTHREYRSDRMSSIDHHSNFEYACRELVTMLQFCLSIFIVPISKGLSK